MYSCWPSLTRQMQVPARQQLRELAGGDGLASSRPHDGGRGLSSPTAA